MNASEILNKAADHIERYGHHKGSGFADGGPYQTAPACTVGAITAVTIFTGGLQLAEAARKAVANYLGQPGIVDWNDAPERTAAEVIEVLRAAALVEAAKETDVVVVAPREGGIAAPLAEVGVK